MSAPTTYPEVEAWFQATAFVNQMKVLSSVMPQFPVHSYRLWNDPEAGLQSLWLHDDAEGATDELTATKPIGT
jgi:hypothetical protein